MSQTRLFDLLEQLYVQKGQEALASCLNHQSYQNFINEHQLKMKTVELSQAFIHTSFAHEFNTSSYEQLEFLGDSVLSLVLTEKLVALYPETKEGILSKQRSSLVNEESLANMARHLKLDQLVLLGKGEFRKNLMNQNTVLADVFEALLAVIYLSSGYDAVKEFFFKILGEVNSDALKISEQNHFDVKSRLQELSLAKFKKLPRYESVDHGNQFKVELWINDELMGSGIFSSKKIGEKSLATEVLAKNIL